MDTQLKGSQDEPTPAGGDGQRVLTSNCWHGSFGSASWSYEPEKASRDFVFAKPPHYHFSLYNKQTWDHPNNDGSLNDIPGTPSEWDFSSNHQIVGEDDELNEELIGVKSTCDLIKDYESAVGFDSSTWPGTNQEDLEQKEKLCADVSESDVKLGKEQWDEMVESLIGRMSLRELLKEGKARPKPTLSPRESLSTTPSANIDYFSRPSTPKPFRLNPTASSFVPLGSPISTISSSSCSSTSSDSSDSLIPLPFPPLSRSFPPPANCKIDHQEYVNGLPERSRTTSSDGSSAISTERPSSNFLPPFLFEPANQRRRGARSSRTRAIVDQLRSRHLQDVPPNVPGSPEPSPTTSDFGFGNSNYPNPRLSVSEDGSPTSRSTGHVNTLLRAEDHQYDERIGATDWSDNVDGWSVLQPPTPVDPETKRTRSKELLLTLRRRTDSLSPNVNHPGSLPALGARPHSLISASTPHVIMESERLVGSPEPTEDQTDHQEFDEEQVPLPWTGRAAQSQLRTKPRNSSPLSHRSSPDSITPLTPEQLYTPARNHLQPTIRPQASAAAITPTHARPLTTAAGYFANSTPGLPYALMGFPLSMPGVPMAVPMSMSMAMASNPHTPMPVPVPIQVPVQTMQYSTLMHLRIMQQMQIMRNSMNIGGNGGSAGVPGGMGR